MTATAALVSPLTPTFAAREILAAEPDAFYALVNNQPAIVALIATAGHFRLQSVRFDAHDGDLAALRAPIFLIVDLTNPLRQHVSFVESTALAKLVELAGPPTES